MGEKLAAMLQPKCCDQWWGPSGISSGINVISHLQQWAGEGDGVPSQQGCAWPQIGSSTEHTGERVCPSDNLDRLRNGLSRTSLNSARANRIFFLQRDLMQQCKLQVLLCRKVLNITSGFPPKLENLCPLRCPRELGMALCNLIYLDLFWAKDQTRHPLMIPSTINFGTMTVLIGV